MTESHKTVGPGRPPKGTKVERMTLYGIYMPEGMAAAIRKFQGDGNLSAGVRKLAARLLK